MQQAALTYIVTQLSSKNEMKELQQTFNEIDKDNDGSISREEMFNAYKLLMASQMNDESIKEEVERIFSTADRDGDGTLSFNEWQTAGANKNQVLQDQKLRQAFEMFDKDGSGQISREEVKVVLGTGKFGSDKAWDDIIKEVDVNGDGEISFDEFKVMM